MERAQAANNSKDGGIFMCNYCEKTFSTFKTMEQHQRTHTGEQPFKCHLCNRAFSQNSSMKRHIGLVHNNNENQVKFVKCAHCPATFNKPALLESHLQLHVQGRPACTTCGRVFINFERLRKHNLIHTGEKPYVCQICSRAFNQLSSKHRHVKLVHRNCPEALALGSKAASKMAPKAPKAHQQPTSPPHGSPPHGGQLTGQLTGGLTGGLPGHISGPLPGPLAQVRQDYMAPLAQIKSDPERPPATTDTGGPSSSSTLYGGGSVLNNIGSTPPGLLWPTIVHQGRESVFRCLQCFEIFDSQLQLSAHMRNHLTKDVKLVVGKLPEQSA